MVPFAPTATNSPLVNVTPNKLFAVGFGDGDSQMAKGSVAFAMTGHAAIAARVRVIRARPKYDKVNIVTTLTHHHHRSQSGNHPTSGVAATVENTLRQGKSRMRA